MTAEMTTEVSDAELLTMYQETRENLERYQQVVHRLEVEIRQRMDSRQAVAIPSDDYLCELKPRNRYDQATFTPLKELLTDADLRACLTPAHQQTVDVADKWSTAKVLAAARRYGGEVRRVVENATQADVPAFRFERRP